MQNVFTFLASLPIRAYRLVVSPLLPAACRFTPTCSQYALEAIEVHGTIIGLYLAVRRVLRCHPFTAISYHPVPPKAGTCARKHSHE
jgi:putative membrane protein insertion efficiency factor